MNNDLIKLFIKVEDDLKNGIIEKDKGIIIFKGEIPILLSASHSVEQIREGKIKYAEGRTAPIVQLLHKKNGCFGAFKTMNFDDDANYDNNNYYKEELMIIVRKHNIKLLLDLHIMAPNREHNIDIGTGFGRNILHRDDLLQVIKSNFELNGIDRVEVDYMFNASFENTVSATISRKCQIPCFQFEINWKLLDEKMDDNKLTNIINAISKSIEDSKEVL